VSETPIRLTYVGGPTLLLELGGLRFLTDPTFDPPGGEYRTPASVLRKTQGPAVSAESLGPVDVVLLSHDHHSDNLDPGGRVVAATAGKVLTTHAGAERLGSKAVGLSPWQTVTFATSGGRLCRVTATPARHGPAGGDRGPVIGFVLALADQPGRAVYVSGDTVWYEEVEEVSRRFNVGVAVLFMGAARVAAAGPAHLTMTAAEGVTAARALANATIVPVHFEGWEHFSESRTDIQAAFDEAGLSHRLRWLTPGESEAV
jgi:L-ascorbate metabolism protein UlaG (beta-lactamase superfamily)